MGHDDQLMFKKIEDIILKTIISCEHVINNANDMFCPAKNNCFELFGFDVLIDNRLEPWLLEVNLTPALGCDSPLDQKIKSNVTADIMSLVGIQTIGTRFKDTNYRKATMAYAGPPSVHSGLLQKKKPANRGTRGAPVLHSGNFDSSATAGLNTTGQGPYNSTIKNEKEPTKEEKIVLKETLDENQRKNFFKRIFPNIDYPYYRQFFEEDRPLNHFIDSKLMSRKRDQHPSAKINSNKMPSWLQPAGIVIS